ncbi:MAG: PQQ-like beta-propeller repeat protein [Rickettsiales bacterium]|jgi:hypothetical protein|nr:PQQ-like beta-propeller repeat protein [Rickettsiales bacterium]
MKKYLILILCIVVMGCDKKDPILPGVRIPIFDSGIKVSESKASVKELIGKSDVPAAGVVRASTLIASLIHMSEDNIITRDFDKHIIFSGFPTATKTGPAIQPVIAGDYLYAGLSTGEILKIHTASGHVVWSIDLSSRTILTGGSPVADVSALRVLGNFVYASTYGGIIAKISAEDGRVIWAAPFGTKRPIFVLGNLVAVVALDGRVVALDGRTGGLVREWNLDEVGDAEDVILVRGKDGALGFEVRVPQKGFGIKFINCIDKPNCPIKQGKDLLYFIGV